ncbi:hypothetical protein Tco_0439124 [Tanacetum coccineum]
MLLCRMSDMAYGPCPIRHISEKSALAVEIDLTWSRGFVSVKLEAQIYLIMFEFSSCLLADSTINLVSDSSRLCLRSGYDEFLLFRWYVEYQYAVLSSQNTPYCLEEHIRRLDCKTQYAVLGRRFDMSYPTGGYGVSSDQSEQNTI